METGIVLSQQQDLSLAKNPVAVYLASLAPGSRRTMKQSLNVIADMVSNGMITDAINFDWHLLRYQHTTAIRSQLQERYAPSTANKILAAMKRTLKECKRLELMSPLDYDKAVDLPTIKGESLPVGRSLSKQEIEALNNSCQQGNPVIGARDLAVFAILRVGLRRSEIVQLDLQDFDTHSHSLNIKRSKGRKSRVVYLPPQGVADIEKWIEIRGSEPGPLIYPINKHGVILFKRMGDPSIFLITKRRAQRIGIEDFSPHDFRRTFAGDLLDAGVDIVTVQQLMGHANPATTAKYDRRGDETKKKAVLML